MTKKYYKENLTTLIKEFGYWSSHVKDLNNLMIDTCGYSKYQKYHNEVMLELKIK